MTKAYFSNERKSFVLEDGDFVTNPSLTGGVKGVLKKDTGNFETINGYNLTQDYINDGTNVSTDSGVYGGYYQAYTQANTINALVKGAGRTSEYGQYFHRPPNIGSASTWGGPTYYPPESMRVPGKRFRWSFDYRGYSGGYTMDCYGCAAVGWHTLGIGLPMTTRKDIPPFDTWEWQHYSHEFTVTEQYVNWIPGQNRPAWNSTTQYSANYDSCTYGGYVYRSHPSNPAPTLGVSPDQEYPNTWNYRVAMNPGEINLYDQFKIGFTYHTQNARGTHVYIDNVRLTDITNNETFKFNQSTNKWEFDEVETGHRFVAVGTSYTNVARTDGDPNDQFGTNGSPTLKIDGVPQTFAIGRGIMLQVFNTSLQKTFEARYDTYGVDVDRTNLANKLGTMTDNDIWVMTSHDAININSALDTQMGAMGSTMYRTPGTFDSILTTETGVAQRAPYAVVGKGQTILKEDGGHATDTTYRRGACVDIRVNV